MSDEIDRQVHFVSVPAYDPLDKTGVNNQWIYDRAPEGYLFELHSVTVSTGTPLLNNFGVFALFDGHEYTHWDIWPGVESREMLSRICFSDQLPTYTEQLFGWLCKEYTIGIRSQDEEHPFKVTAIVWYTLKKATRELLMEYALKHPSRQDTFKRALRGTTIDIEEA